MPPKTRKVSVPMSIRAGLLLPVGRVRRMMKKHSNRVSPVASVYLTGVSEYLIRDIINAVLQDTRDKKKKRVQATHVKDAIDTRSSLFKEAEFSIGGV